MKILFKAVANPDSQISFSKSITARKQVSEYSFEGEDGLNYIVLNSTILKSESEDLEFKNYDFRNIYDNTRKLEEVITGKNTEFVQKQCNVVFPIVLKAC